MPSNSKLVYSTDKGRIRQEPDATPKVKADGTTLIKRETKGRKGKGVSLIEGLNLEPEALKKLTKQLKQLCGTGGTLKDGVIEIQGDHRDKLLTFLVEKGIKAKKSGG